MVKSFHTPPQWRRNTWTKVRVFPERAKQNWTLLYKTNPPCLHANLYLTQRTQRTQRETETMTGNTPPAQNINPQTLAINGVSADCVIT